MKKPLLALLTAISFITAMAQHEHADSAGRMNNELFGIVKALVGNWKGKFKWIGKTSEGEMDAKYYATGNGTAIVEDLISGGNVVMSSIYHVDGKDLRVTHYCAAGNQPRLKADHFDRDNKSLSFQMIDITNLQTPEAAHVHGIQLKFEDTNHLKIFFRVIASGVESIEQIDLSRTN